MNGFYIGQHRGGYDPFSFDVTDFIIPGAPNVLLVRVEATLSDGWFYEGAGIYRHAWLVKTCARACKAMGHVCALYSPIRQRPRCKFARTWANDGDGPHNVRVVSTIFDPAGKAVAKTTSTPIKIQDSNERTFEQQVSITAPALWSFGRS